MQNFRAIALAMVLMFSFQLSSHCQHLSGTKYVKPLKVGDRMPDMELGKITNNPSGKKRLSDFKGKLVILDFWRIYCGSCVANFPHMEKLQNQFGDKIQIILVNTGPNETPATTNQIFKSGYLRNKLHFPDLPAIYNAQSLLRLFPHVSVPHHVWIDSRGIVRLIGSDLNTNAQKIQELLDGKPITYMKDSNGNIYNPKLSLNVQVNESKKETILFQSFFTKFNDNFGVDFVENHVDSASNNVRNTYQNTSVLDLYYQLSNRLLANDSNKIIYETHSIRRILTVKDSSNYFFGFIPENEERTPENFTKSMFCYEQITPANISEQDRSQYMLADLNRYFGALYGTYASIANKRLRCYILRSVSGVSKSLSTGGNQHFEHIPIDGKTCLRYTATPLKEIIASAMMTIFGSSKDEFICVDETGYVGKADMILPDFAAGGTIESLTAALKNYGLDIVQAERDFKVLVICERCKPGSDIEP
jgi:thiol-disulfide isomerase/thioredoxin